MLLGLGEDAHIASIFPGSSLLNMSLNAVGAGFSRLKSRLVAAVWAEHLHAWRITLTPPALLDARAIVVLVSGGHKAAAVRAALDGPEDFPRWPAQLLRAAGARVEWLIDSAAAPPRAAPLS
jgi:6-phosphogluconolactonase